MIKWEVTTTGDINPKDFVTIITNSKLSSIKFIELYYDFYTETQNAQKAYEKTENLHEAIFGSRKYSDYDTFRVQKTYFMKK
jgi:hypothetical protein